MNKTIKQITLSGCLSAIAIVVGIFLHFNIFGGNLYVIGIIIFLFPLLLRIDFVIISSIISVSITDIFTGFGQYTWISILAYGFGVIIIWLFSKLRFKLAYMLGVLLAGIFIIVAYFFLELIVFDLSIALRDLATTSLEILISLSVVSFLYHPTKIIAKALV